MEKLNKTFLYPCVCWEKLNKRCFLFFMTVTFLVYGFLFSKAFAFETITKDYSVVEGSNLSSGVSVPFTSGEIERIKISDDKTRLISDPWPKNGSYDESRYLEFIFSADVPDEAIIDSVTINHEYRRSGAMDGAKLEIWNGENFTNIDINKSPIDEDNLESLDITSNINNPNKVNNLKIRFLAYRSEGVDTTTGHDFVGLNVVYHIPDIEIEPSSDPLPTDPPEDNPSEKINNDVPFTKIDSDILEDTIWTKASSPYIINESIFVNSDITLTIEPGVVVKFNPENQARLNIYGKIIANGTVEDSVYFTSNYDDIGGSTDGDSEYCYYVDYDNNGNPIGDEICEIEDWNTPDFEFVGGLYFFNSEGSDLKNVSLNYLESAIVLDFSKVNFSNLNIKNSDSGIEAYNSSFLNIDGLNISDANISIFNSSSLYLNESYIQSGIRDGLDIYSGSSAVIKNSSFLCDGDGIIVFNNSSIDISNTDIKCGNYGILVYYDSSASIVNSKISGAQDTGIIAFNNSILKNIKIEKSEIYDNNYGFIFWDSPFLAKNNSIHNNVFGALTFGTELNPIPASLDFTSNYWGDPSGPKHVSNPSGVGNEISDYINFIPFLKIDPLKNIRNPVILIPGITGSYLYKNYGDKSEIWPNLINMMLSSDDSYLNDLVLNKDGTENIEFPIISKDIIRGIANIHVFDLLIKEFIDNGYVEGEDLHVFPYDWRMDTESSAALLKNKIDEILSNSEQAKVDIVAHSMGGLIAKKYIVDYGESRIDQLVFLGTPQLGAPKAFKTLMFGDNMSYKFLILGLDKLRAKLISQNMPSVYELLPSKKYIQENGGYAIDALHEIIGVEPVVLDYFGTKDLMIEKGRNPLMYPFAEDLHNSIDNLDLSNIKTYNIVGCGAPTIGGITATQERSWKKLYLGLADDYRLKYVDGDETVPFVSSTKTIGSDIYYVKGVTHGDLPSADGVKQNVVSILNNNPILTSGTFMDNNSSCGIEGKVVSTHSPVELHVYDEGGHHTGPSGNGDIEYGIEGVSFDIVEGENYVFLPNNKNFKIVTKATDIGGFNLMIENQDKSENITSVDKWTLIPLSSLETTGEIWVGPSYSPDSYEVKIDNNGDGKIDQNYVEGFDGTKLAEKSLKGKERSYHSVGSLPHKNEESNEKHNFIFVDNKPEDNKNKNDFSIKKILFEKNDKMNENNSKENIFKKEIPYNNLSASAGSLYLDNFGKIKAQLIIAGGIVLLLLGLKFIFKII